MTFSRGLAALILTLIFSTSLSAKFLYKDEVIHDANLTQELEHIGSELYDKTGISLYVVVVRELPNGEPIVTYEQSLAPELQEPYVLLTIAELDKQVDIIARPTSLYEDFDKEQVLSPFPNSGTIIPLLAWRSKDATISERYGGAVLNGYMDIAEQLATSQGKTLESIPVGSNKMIFTVLRYLFYGMILYAIFLWARRKYLTRKSK